jgi:hypothetical protein
MPAATAMQDRAAELRQEGRLRDAAKIDEFATSVLERKRIGARTISSELSVSARGTLPYYEIAARQVSLRGGVLGRILDLRQLSDGVMKENLMFNGISTFGYADNSRIPCCDCMEVTGTQTYPTASGTSKTVRALRVFNDAPFASYIRLAYGKKKLRD